MSKYNLTESLPETKEQRSKGSIIQYMISRFFFTVVMLVIIMAIAPYDSVAQSGSVTGGVIDAATGEPLSGALVMIADSRLRTTTDAHGRFTLRRTPVGSQRLVIDHIGYVPQEIEITMGPGVILDQPVELASAYFEGDEVFVVVRRRAQARALNRQWESVNIKSVIPFEQMDRFADYTVEEAMIRVPGVQINHRGEINLRGVGPDRHNVTIDGQRVGTTGMGDRSFDLGSISTDAVRDLEVIKVITPDMDADALSGIINLVTHRPVGGERKLEGHLGGGANARYFNQMGPESRAMFNYAESPRDDFSFAVNLNHQLDNHGWESLGIVYDVADFGNGPVDVIERVTPALHTNEQNRLGGGLQFTFQPSERTTYHFRGTVNNNGRRINQHSSSWNAGSDWIDPTTTGIQGQQGSYGYDAGIQDITVRQYVGQVGVRHLFDKVNLEYNAGWSQSRISHEQLRFPFLIDRLNMTIDMEDRTRPAMHVNNIILMQDGTIDRRLINLQHIDRTINDHTDNRLSGRIDVEYPFRLGSFKIGSSALMTHKDGDFRETTFDFRRLSLFRFRLNKDREFDVLDQYHIPWLVETEEARLFFYRNRLGMTHDESLERRTSDIWNYEASEYIYAGYGMATLEFGRFKIVGGARLEHTVAQYDGREVAMSIFGLHESTVITSRTKNHTYLFPNAQVKFATGAWSNIRAGYSRSIARPEFNLLAPFELANHQNSTLFRGNPDLDPMISDNLDVQYEQFFNSVGVFSVGLYFKQLSGFIIERQSIVNEGEYEGYMEQTFINGDDTAMIYGVEVSWQQNLSFLPGLLSNFSTFANYTWSHSVYDIDSRQEDVALPHQSPHVINVALDYSQGRFSTQLSYHWTAPALNGLQETTQMAPSISRTEAVYLDRYQDGWKDMSVSLRYRLTDNFRVWADVSNLLGDERVQYAHTRDLYPIESYSRGARDFKVGIIYNL